MTFFVDTFDYRHKRAALIWARDDMDTGDRWGWAMSWLFDLCAAIELRGEFAPPECNYQSGACGPMVEDEERAAGMSYLSTESLYYAARVLNRYCDALDKAGESY